MMGYIMIIDDIYLVGGFVAILKNMKLNGKDYPIYSHILWKIKNV
jgi:hypothetical protein